MDKRIDDKYEVEDFSNKIEEELCDSCDSHLDNCQCPCNECGAYRCECPCPFCHKASCGMQCSGAESFVARVRQYCSQPYFDDALRKAATRVEIPPRRILH